MAAGPQLAFAETLTEAVRSALTTNPTVRAESAEARAAALELLQLQGDYLPTVSLFGDVRSETIDDPANLSALDNNDTKTARQAGLQAEITLYDGLARENRVFAGSARVDGRIFSLLDASETLALTAVEAYVDVLRRQALAVVARENVARHEELGAQVRQAVEGGRLPASDGFEAENRILATRVAELRVREAIANANSRYTRVIGKAPTGGMAVPRVRNLPQSAAQTVQLAVDNSFRVRAADTAIRQRQYERVIVEADRRPRVSLNAGVTTGEDLAGSAGSRDESFVGLQLNWTLFKGGRDPETRALIERREKAILERNAAIRDVREMAERTWHAHRADLARLRLLTDQEAANERIVAQYREEFAAGTRTLLDLLDAERALFNVRFQKVSAASTVSFNQYRLVAAQSKLANMFGIAPANMTLLPDFEARALQRPASVFNTEVAPLQ
ncbi:MAG: TolC family protein [Pseudomonadota bacterium]